MFTLITKILGITDNKEIGRRLANIIVEKEKQRERFDDLYKASMDGEDLWFRSIVKKNMKQKPECRAAIIENCLEEKKVNGN